MNNLNSVSEILNKFSWGKYFKKKDFGDNLFLNFTGNGYELFIKNENGSLSKVSFVEYEFGKDPKSNSKILILKNSFTYDEFRRNGFAILLTIFREFVGFQNRVSYIICPQANEFSSEYFKDLNYEIDKIELDRYRPAILDIKKYNWDFNKRMEEISKTKIFKKYFSK